MAPYHRQSDHTAQKNKQRGLAIRLVLMTIVKRRSENVPSSSQLTTAGLITFCQSLVDKRRENERYTLRKQIINDRGFTESLEFFTDRAFLELFRFTRKDFQIISRIVGLSDQEHTSKNRFSVDEKLSTAIVLRRLSTPARWCDLEFIFRRHTSHLCEIFWETCEKFWGKYHRLLTDFPIQYIQERLEEFAMSIHETSFAISNCVGFIDGTVIAMARPGTDAMQRDCYNGHKRKHALKYQAVTTADGMIINLSNPFVGRRHDWYMYLMSGLEDILPVALEFQNNRYCIWGDPGYNNRWYLETPFQGVNISPAQQAFNTAMSAVRITVEWAFQQVKLYWTATDFKRKMKLRESPIAVIYHTAVLLSNFKNCLNPNATSQYFNCPPPDLEEYLSLLNENESA